MDKFEICEGCPIKDKKECLKHFGNGFCAKYLMVNYQLRDLILDFLRIDYNLTRKESKPYLCQICKLNETCQNNFDYECIEASDFLFTKETIFTVKDDFLDSLTNKDNKALRG